MKDKNYTELATLQSKLLSTIYPVGAIYISTNSVNPGDLFGGTWEAFAQGRTIVGCGTIEDRDFVVGQTGGACTHTLTTQEMPVHTHKQKKHKHETMLKNYSFCVDYN